MDKVQITHQQQQFNLHADWATLTLKIYVILEAETHDQKHIISFKIYQNSSTAM